MRDIFITIFFLENLPGRFQEPGHASLGRSHGRQIAQSRPTIFALTAPPRLAAYRQFHRNFNNILGFGQKTRPPGAMIPIACPEGGSRLGSRPVAGPVPDDTLRHDRAGWLPPAAYDSVSSLPRSSRQTVRPPDISAAKIDDSIVTIPPYGDHLLRAMRGFPAAGQRNCFARSAHAATGSVA